MLRDELHDMESLPGSYIESRDTHRGVTVSVIITALHSTFTTWLGFAIDVPLATLPLQMASH